jgi:hypothetical protein
MGAEVFRHYQVLGQAHVVHDAADCGFASVFIDGTKEGLDGRGHHRRAWRAKVSARCNNRPTQAELPAKLCKGFVVEGPLPDVGPGSRCLEAS